MHILLHFLTKKINRPWNCFHFFGGVIFFSSLGECEKMLETKNQKCLRPKAKNAWAQKQKCLRPKPKMLETKTNLMADFAHPVAKSKAQINLELKCLFCLIKWISCWMWYKYKLKWVKKKTELTEFFSCSFFSLF